MAIKIDTHNLTKTLVCLVGFSAVAFIQYDAAQQPDEQLAKVDEFRSAIFGDTKLEKPDRGCGVGTSPASPQANQSFKKNFC